jgi:hypothetical protein
MNDTPGLPITSAENVQAINDMMTPLIRYMLTHGTNPDDLVAALLGKAKTIIAMKNDRATYPEALQRAADYMLVR